ncbi:hypothetical protein ER57_17950 [Smithella sp. SCADC]|jgi:hypothetical protein|nr:hypothetical protein ER57_17950 [Smithella sp. SCADC]
MVSDESTNAVEYIRSELVKTKSTTWRRAFQKFALAALGSIPWVGGFIAAAMSLKTDEASIRQNNLQNQWLEEHTNKMSRLAKSFDEITGRFDNLGEQIYDRIQSEEYLDVVRKAFRTWDNADTDEKRRLVGNLVANAAGTQLSSDDVLRLFIDWLDKYHEAHFAVIQEIYKNPGVTRYDIWMTIKGEMVREDSADADLYKMLIRDLSIGGVIRQARDTTEDGKFLRKPRPQYKRTASSTMESAFEDTKPYILTELGEQFVHYAMTELVPRVNGAENHQKQTSV